MHGQVLIIGSIKKLKVWYRRPVSDCNGYMYWEFSLLINLESVF